MTQIDKLLAKFFQNPESISYSDLTKILIVNGFSEIKAKWSHVKWKHELLSKDLIIPIHNNDCKPTYKKLAKKSIQELP